MQRRFNRGPLPLMGAVLLAAGVTTLVTHTPKAVGSDLRPGALNRSPGPQGEGTLLFSGWRVQPAGRSISTGDMLLGGALSPDGKTLAIANAGFAAHAIHLVDVASEKEIATLAVPRLWGGIVWSAQGDKVFVSGGTPNGGDDVHVVTRDADGKWILGKGLKLTGSDPKNTCISGLALTPDSKTLYVTNTNDNSLYAVDTTTGKTNSKAPAGDHPGLCRLSTDGMRLYVPDWGGAEVAVFDTHVPGIPTLLRKIATQGHPNDLLLSKDDRLFVTCGSDDVVMIFDAETGRSRGMVHTALSSRAPRGSTPDALALSPDGKTLYVANADNNNVCVINTQRNHVMGFIPTGWYPTAVLISADGGKLLIGSGKGLGTHSNPPTVNPTNPVAPEDYKAQYIGEQLHGLLSFMETPDMTKLAEYTRTVMANTPYRDALVSHVPTAQQTAVPGRVGQSSPIKYVLYIIKENRTYDQVLGDLPQGNGDASMTLFGREVTPNHHALAEKFVLLDNLYCSGEVSQDGHPWSCAAYNTDFNERAWVLGYSDNGDLNVTGSVGDSAGGYLWQACARKGLSYRSYGEFADHPSLAGHISEPYIGKVKYGEQPPGRDTDKANIFLREFHEFEQKGTMPRFMVMSLGEDHTSGTRPGAFTPKASVASNDVALGKIVEGVTQSKLWKEFAIFVIEDDAQNGADHVDAHRTVGLVISPYTRHHFVDHTMYMTVSMERTMELILGLSPLTQHDAAAPVMFASFTDRADLSPYTALPAQIDLNARNKATAYGAKASSHMDFREYDRADPIALNDILWHSIKGAKTPYPVVSRR